MLLVPLVSCEKSGEVVVTETRERTTKDGKPKLFATSDERFRDAKPSPVEAGELPRGWLRLPATQFRLLNYRFGASGTGEVWVSLSSGGTAANVNRWLGQFGAEALDVAGLEGLEKVDMAGSEGVWVEAAGTYAGGMGSPPKDGYGLAGVIAEVGGRIVTVKMVGPQAEVEGEREALRKFAAGLKLAE